MRAEAKLVGDKELLKTLEDLYGPKKIKQIKDKALTEGAKVMVDIIKRDLEPHAVTGATVKETTYSSPMWFGGLRTIKIHWKGPRQRFRIIHLNEFGHFDKRGKKAGQWVNPPQKGVIDRALKTGQDTYFATITKEIKRMV